MKESTTGTGTFELTAENLQAWRLRMRDVLAGSAGDFAILEALVTAYLIVAKALSAARVSLARLRRLFGLKHSEKTRDVLGEASGQGEGKSGSDGASIRGEAGEGTGSTDKPGPKKKKPVKGHGRNGVKAYTGAVRIPVPLENLQTDCLCPECRKGKLTALDPAVLLRVFGQPVLTARIWELERRRCSLCKQIFRARPPAEASGPTYDATAVAMIALLHFGNGFPYKRLEHLQASLGIPVPASDQSELLRDTYRGLQSVWQALVRCAAQCEVVHNDDTGMKILSLLALIKSENASGRKDVRTGIFTTGIVAITGGRRIALFYTGRKHAGENLAAVFEHRDPALPPPTHMSDGLDRNAPGDFPTDEAKCLVHGRRQVIEAVSCFPDKCRRIVEDIAEVYHIDAIAREQNLSPKARLLLHQEKSAPVMESLERWMTDQLESKEVEPNSVLGKAITYLLRRWTSMTLFLRKAGAPLDNNSVERILKRAIRHRKNSLFYKTEQGAAVGDFFMSLIETCALNRVDIFHYLTSLVRNIHRVKDSPESWLPWNYQTMLGNQARSATAVGTGPEPLTVTRASFPGPSPSRTSGDGPVPANTRPAPVALDQPERPQRTTSCPERPGVGFARHGVPGEARPPP